MFAKARRFCSQEMRQASCSPAGPELQTVSSTGLRGYGPAGCSGWGDALSTTSVFSSARSCTRMPARECSGHQRSAPSASTLDLREEVHVGHQVARTESVLAELRQEAVARVAVEFVAVLLVARLSEAHEHALRGRMSAHGVVPAAIVVGDRDQHAAHVRVQRMASSQEEGVLALQGVGHVVALDRDLEVEEECGDVRASLADR